MNDKILIKGLKVFAYHGVKEEEKQNGQYFIIDCVLDIDRTGERFNDDINSTISYSKAAKVIRDVLIQKSYNLIETAAENVVFKLFTEFQMLLGVELILKKPEAPINLEFDYMGVKINRSREDFIWSNR